MKKIIVIIALFVRILSSNCAEFSDSLETSVLTVSQGTELYSTFGHTAIRIKDLVYGYDYVFNYGTFDFSTRNFYLKFALGQLDYMLSVDQFEGFMQEYRFENRSVSEQVLNLDKNQKQFLLRLLLENYKPENRYYRYKFFTDNCSTRIRDVIAEASGDSDILKKSMVNADNTYRELYTRYLTTLPWSKFGIALVLGKMTDDKAGYNALFIPDYLEKSIDLAKINNKPLVKSKSVLFEKRDEITNSPVFTPLLLSLIILCLSIVIQFKRKWVRTYDNVFFAVFGFLGLFITVLSVFSHHAEVHYNLVVLFILPTNIILPFIKQSSFRRKYCIAALSIMVLCFLLIPVLPQTFNISVLILAAAIGLRLFFNFKVNKS